MLAGFELGSIFVVLLWSRLSACGCCDYTMGFAAVGGVDVCRREGRYREGIYCLLRLAFRGGMGSLDDAVVCSDTANTRANALVLCHGLHLVC